MLSLAPAFAWNGQAPDKLVRIELESTLCAAQNKISVTYGGYDVPVDAVKVCEKPQDVSGRCCMEGNMCCHWVLPFVGDPGISKFSLRFGGTGRTGCKKPDRNGDQWSVFFSEASEEPAHDFVIRGDLTNYVRIVHKMYQPDDRRPCSERWLTSHKLSDVQLDIEDVRLLIFKKPEGCALLIDDLLSKTKKGASVDITQNEVENQSLKGTICIVPTVLPPGITKDAFGKNGFTIKVQ